MDERPYARQLPVVTEASCGRDIVTIGNPVSPRLERLGRINRLPTIFADPLARYHETELAGRNHMHHLIEIRG